MAMAQAARLTNGEKAKIKGTIVSLHGDLSKVQDKKSGTVEFVKLEENTKIEPEKEIHEFFQHEDMDITASCPRSDIDSEGVGNAQGEVEAQKIKFNPDIFAIEVAEEQNILSNEAASAEAQSTVNLGVGKANVAQSAADEAQFTVNESEQTAHAAGVMAVPDAFGVQTVNRRVSVLADYSTLSGIQITSRMVARNWIVQARRPLTNLLLPLP